MNDLDNFLGSIGNRVGGFLQNVGGRGSSILDSFADKLRGTFGPQPGETYLRQPDGSFKQVPYGTRSDTMPLTPTPTMEKSRADEVGRAVTPKEQGQVKGTSDKVTIKKTLDSGEKVTINVDLPNPEQEVPGGIDTAMNYIQSKTPPGMAFEQAFPAYANEDFMQALIEADQKRKGLSNLLALQAFYESTGGRSTPNVFGVKPGGQSRYFDNPLEALQYQLGPEVLGGGANPAMNILDEQNPLTLQDIIDLYGSYNPESYYLEDLLKILGGD